MTEPRAEKKKPSPFTKMTRRYVTRANRWGLGRVHAMAYDREARSWRLACRDTTEWGLPYHGEMVPVTEEQPDITCKRCLAALGGAV